MTKTIKLILSAIVLMSVLLGAGYGSQYMTIGEVVRQSGVPVRGIEILGQIPHNPASFTQGLLYADGVLYESTGGYGASTVQKIDPGTGKVLQVVKMEDRLFGEGLALCEDRLYQITWEEKTVLIYDKDSLKLLDTTSFDTDGWGLAFDGELLLLSDGTPTLYYYNPADFSLSGRVMLSVGGRYLLGLNELEYVDGVLYGNLLGEDLIVEIDPNGGEVKAVYDASAVREQMPPQPEEHPMNGIAYEPASGEWYLTGKNWPNIFRVRFIRNPEK